MRFFDIASEKSIKFGKTLQSSIFNIKPIQYKARKYKI